MRPEVLKLRGQRESSISGRLMSPTFLSVFALGRPFWQFGHSPRKMFQLPSQIEFFHESTRFAPVGLNFDIEFKKYFRSHHALDLQARRSANSFQHLSFFADQDAFLALAFAVDRRGNSRQPRAFLETLNND